VAAGAAESAELDFLERLDFLVVEAEASALAALDLLASALAAEFVVEDFFKLELFWGVLEESELSAAAAESADVDFLDLDFDLEVESVSFESEACFASAAVSDFFDFDLVFVFGALDSV